MKRSKVLTVTVAVWLFVQIAAAAGARAEQSNLAVDVSAGAASALATLIALPLRAVTCIGAVAIGGAAYGLTMGTSELLREELVAATNYCGGRYYITPKDVKQLTRDPEQRR